MNKTINLIVLLAVFLATPALAKSANTCPDFAYDLVEKYAKKDNFFLRSEDPEGVIIAEACKPWSYRGDYLLAAIAYDEGIEYEKTLIVALLDNHSKRVSASYKMSIGEDAATEVGEGSFKFDTARYAL